MLVALLACSISMSRLLQGTSPLRCLELRYSSAWALRAQTSGSRRTSWLNLSTCWGYEVMVYSSRALFTCSCTLSTSAWFSSSFTSAKIRDTDRVNIKKKCSYPCLVLDFIYCSNSLNRNKGELSVRIVSDIEPLFFVTLRYTGHFPNVINVNMNTNTIYNKSHV